MSSYIAEEVFQRGNWLSEGIYKDILDLFDFQPRLKINISDNKQSFTPFFSGHLNFIAANTPNFWHLTVRLPKTNEVFNYNRLIFSNEIAKVCRTLESVIFLKNNFEENIENLWQFLPKIISLEQDAALELPNFSLPYYEGFNRYDQKTWLGIYRRDEVFSVRFLKELCEIALKTNVNEICVTTWKYLNKRNLCLLKNIFWKKKILK